MLIPNVLIHYISEFLLDIDVFNFNQTCKLVTHSIMAMPRGTVCKFGNGPVDMVYKRYTHIRILTTKKLSPKINLNGVTTMCITESGADQDKHEFIDSIGILPTVTSLTVYGEIKINRLAKFPNLTYLDISGGVNTNYIDRSGIPKLHHLNDIKLNYFHIYPVWPSVRILTTNGLIPEEFVNLEEITINDLSCVPKSIRPRIKKITIHVMIVDREFLEKRAIEYMDFTSFPVLTEIELIGSQDRRVNPKTGVYICPGVYVHTKLKTEICIFLKKS